MEALRVDVARMARDIDHEAIRATAEAVREQSARIAETAREAARLNSEWDREHARAAAEIAREQSRMTSEIAREQARIASEVAREQSRAIADRARDVARVANDFSFHYTPAPSAPVAMPAFAFGREDFRVPRPQFVQGEPSDSLYRLAHELLNRGEYGRSAQLFKDIAQKYPNSVYQNDLPYYEAFARFRIGTTPELEMAAKLLEPRASKLIGVVQQSSNISTSYAYGRRTTNEGDVTGLYIRINSVLASRGNNNAASIVAKAAQSGPTCDREDMSVKTEAMGALSQMDPAQATPVLRSVLNKKDECSIELRKRAVFILGRRGDTESASLLASTAKADPSTDVRVDAITWLPKVQGEAGVNMLEELLRTDQEERIQRAAIRTLNSSENQRARNSMRALIDRKDAPISLRLEAISSFSAERSTTDDANYLRNLYSRADNDRLKEAAINAVARIGGPENDQWILNLARNTNEPSQFRATAISRLIRSNISIGDLSKLYDAADSYDVRSRIVNVLENRREPEAAEKLVDIIRNSTDTKIRTQALRSLGNKKDPRAAQLYLEILDGKRP
jgi:HEAT repeat protein/TolA-binding protein